MDGPTPGQLLKEARTRRGVSQKRLAIRAGTTQSVISRIETDGVSPSVETLRELLHLLGEDLVLGTEQREWGIDRSQIQERLRIEPEARVDQGLAFGELVLETHKANAA
jgi:transcriptional regulator with XRE-family HTH domain